MTRMFEMFWVALAAVILFPWPGRAEEPALELTPTVHCLGLRIKGVAETVTGAKLQYRKAGDKEWKEALPLIVSLGNKYADEESDPDFTGQQDEARHSPVLIGDVPIIRRLHGSIFWLEPATEYEVQATSFDKDNKTGQVFSGKVKTLPDNPWTTPGKGRTLKVGLPAPGGPAGANEEYKTIREAVKNAKAGDTVLVKPGIYKESVWLEAWPSGEPDNPITIRGEKGAILDGTELPTPPEEGQSGFNKNNDVHAGFNIKDAHDIILEGFLVRGYNYRIFVDHCRRVVVQKNLLDCKAVPEWAKNYGIRFKRCSDCLIQYNVATEPKRGEGDYTRYPYSFELNRRLIIRYNKLLGGGCHDCISTRRHVDTDIYENMIRGQTADDGLELEGGTCINVRFFNNWLDCSGGFKGTVSTTPVLVGPVYVVRNVFLCSAEFNKYYNGGIDAALKAGQKFCDFGSAYFYHNMIHNPTHRFFRGACALGRPVFLNNITWGIVIPDLSKKMHLDQTNQEFFYPRADYNLYWDNGKTTKSPTPELDANSLFADPQFADVAKGDFHLQPGSPAIDKAMRLPNINDHFAGTGPDIGCFEAGTNWTGRTLKQPLPDDPRPNP